MTKNKKILILGTFVIIVIIISSVIYSKKNKNPKSDTDEYKGFFDIDSIQYEDLLKKDGETINLDSISVTLESYIYDKGTRAGLCKFSIRQNDGKTDLLELSEWWNGASVDNYSIEPIMSGSQGTRFRLEGDVLYYYLRFYASEYSEGYEDRVYIDDLRTVEWNDYFFELEGTDGKTYLASDITINLSPLALLIEWNQEVKDIIICINGKEKTIMKDGVVDKNVTSTRHSNGSYQSLTVGFMEVYNIKNIDTIIINDKEYKLH